MSVCCVSKDRWRCGASGLPCLHVSTIVVAWINTRATYAIHLAPSIPVTHQRKAATARCAVCMLIARQALVLDSLRKVSRPGNFGLAAMGYKEHGTGRLQQGDEIYL
jgi:hypothetical protein